jgi:hypothetical protein
LRPRERGKDRASRVSVNLWAYEGGSWFSYVCCWFYWFYWFYCCCWCRCWWRRGGGAGATGVEAGETDWGERYGAGRVVGPNNKVWSTSERASRQASKQASKQEKIVARKLEEDESGEIEERKRAREREKERKIVNLDRIELRHKLHTKKYQ